ncbi:MAG TPA: polysaccharide export protein [Campylobacterales bacterium]|nr:polysaccharide export protein [Campylobacterales bacterium]
MKKLWVIWLLAMGELLSVDVGHGSMDTITIKGSGTTQEVRYYGESLFEGNFKENRQLRYSADYLVNIGDTVSVKLWGAYEYQSSLTVDSKGNIFIPKVGTIHLLGVRSESIATRVKKSVQGVFNNNVFVYAHLENFQPISVFVAGGVRQPGLYEGLSSDSILQFIDKAGGIENGEGSYREIQLLRANRVVKTVDLYQFLLQGRLTMSQFKNGDVLQVGKLQNSIRVEGEVRRPVIFELPADSVMVDEVMQYVVPKPNVTHFMVTRWQNGYQSVQRYDLTERYRVAIQNGETIHFMSDYLQDNLIVKIEGEHGGLNTMTVQKGANLESVLQQISFTSLSDPQAVQLYRKSIAQKQKQLIQANLKDLEARVLTTGSSTTEEAKIRKEESSLVLDFIKRASEVEPKGQIIINESSDLSQVILEAGDTIYIPKRSQVVVVEGEVSLPNAQTHVEGYTVDDYIESCGSYSPRANQEKVLLVKKNGRVLTYDASNWWRKKSMRVEPGDSILVLGKVDSKNIQITSSVTQILYQIAVGAAVVLRAF